MTRPDRRLFLAGCLLMLGAPGAWGKTLDALGRPVEARPEGSILSLGADITEIIAALGAGKRIVARDRSSTYPPEMAALPSVGQRRALSSEGVMSVRADLIIAAEDIGPPEVLDFLLGQSVPMVLVPHEFSLPGIVAKITIIAAATGRETEGRALSDRITEEYHAAEALSHGIPDEERRRAAFFHGLTSFSAAGSGTAAGEILRAAGARNIFADYNGYLPASPELILARDPEVLVLMPDGSGGPTPEHVFAMPAFATTTAARTGGLIVLDDNLMIGFGPRTAAQIGKLARLLYPDIL